MAGDGGTAVVREGWAGPAGLAPPPVGTRRAYNHHTMVYERLRLPADAPGLPAARPRRL
jgi:hypothetical protein